MNFYFNKSITNIRKEQILLLVVYTDSKAGAVCAEKMGSELTRQDNVRVT
jgi:hypothetical protein